ncbi:DIS3-like exonuclease 2 [Anopheles ziemanni]|nr:DIS3-like exonuclease 2 [Anopheles ziemanni]
MNKQVSYTPKATYSAKQNDGIKGCSQGFVVTILEKRHNRQCIGKFLPHQESNYRVLVPVDRRIPPLHVFKHNLPAELNKKGSTSVATNFYLAEIVEWQNDIPIGANLISIDKYDIVKNQNEPISINKNQDATRYADHILAQLPTQPYSIPQEEIDLREDLRRECTFTIDSASARHLDDALSCKMLENGNWEIGVHISDVTYFLREQSELDELAKLRATTSYMADNVYRMIPEQLRDVCSLLPGQEKLTFSVFFEILRDGTVVNTRFARSVINSCAKLSYENAQIVINSAKGEGSSEDVVQQIFHGYTVQSLSLILCQLHSIAVKLRQRRIEEGFLELDQSRLTFWIDTATGCPIEYDQHKLKKALDVFVALANTSAAQAIQGALSAKTLIRYPQPPFEKIEEFVKTMAGHGYTISFASSRTVRESMDAIIAAAEHPDAAKAVLNKLLLQFQNCWMPNLPYTSFTRPFRHYTDCMVHRVLAAELGFGEESKRTLEELQEIGKTCSVKRYGAKVAGDTSFMFCYRQWLKTVQTHETMAGVVGYDAEHIELILLGTGITLNIVTQTTSSIAKIVFNSYKPIDGIQWIPADSSMPAVTLKIFSKIHVTITSVGDHISVCSILPIATETTSSETCEENIQEITWRSILPIAVETAASRKSYEDYQKKKKYSFMDHKMFLPAVSFIGTAMAIGSLIFLKKKM